MQGPYFTLHHVYSTVLYMTGEPCCVEQVQMPSSLEYQPVECAIVVNAAGAFSGKLAEMMGIGCGPKDTIAGIPVPVEPRKRLAFNLKTTSTAAVRASGFL